MWPFPVLTGGPVSLLESDRFARIEEVSNGTYPSSQCVGAVAAADISILEEARDLDWLDERNALDITALLGYGSKMDALT